MDLDLSCVDVRLFCTDVGFFCTNETHIHTEKMHIHVNIGLFCEDACLFAQNDVQQNLFIRVTRLSRDNSHLM